MLAPIAVGGFGDCHFFATPSGAFASVVLAAAALGWTRALVIPARLNLFVWAVATFALVPALQMNVANLGQGAPNLVSTFNIAAFNVGKVVGA